MISKRAYPATIKYNDILHIFGGYDYDHDILKSSETINPDGQAKVEGHFSFKSYLLGTFFNNNIFQQNSYY